MALRVDRKLNLVVPVERDGRVFTYVHSMPLPRSVFERYFLIMAQTFGALYAQQLNFFAGPKVAKLMLKKAAIESGTWEGDDGVENGLLNEVRRLSNVAVPSSSGGWEQLPYATALARSIFSEDEIEEVESHIIFFILSSAMQKGSHLSAFLDGMNALWGTLTTFSSITEFIASLPISMLAENTGEKEMIASVPS